MRRKGFDRERASEGKVLGAMDRSLGILSVEAVRLDPGHRDAEVACEPLQIGLAEDPLVADSHRGAACWPS